jgi:hypothetical protein
MMFHLGSNNTLQVFKNYLWHDLPDGLLLFKNRSIYHNSRPVAHRWTKLLFSLFGVKIITKPWLWYFLNIFYSFHLEHIV